MLLRCTRAGRPLARSLFFFSPPSASLELKVDTRHQHVHRSDAHFQAQSGHDGSLQCVGDLPATPAAGRLPPVSRPSQKALMRFAHSVHMPLKTFIRPLYRSSTSYIVPTTVHTSNSRATNKDKDTCSVYRSLDQGRVSFSEI